MQILLHRPQKEVLIFSAAMVAVVVATIVYGQSLTAQGVVVRRWNWENLLWVLPIIPLLLLQQAAGLPALYRIGEVRTAWWQTAGFGVVFGLLDVLVIKVILHPQPYAELPPFLQPFPYSLFLYGSGALEVELYHRMLPLTVLLLAEKQWSRGRYRKGLLIALFCITSLIEPLQQWPIGPLWLVAYATASGIAMNAWQFACYLRFGFGGALAVRLGHYLVWHILLGIYVQSVEL